MKRAGILNAALLAAIGRLGHTDCFVVADCGLPVPPGVPVIDLAVVMGLPRFSDVLDALLEDVVIEQATVAEEASGAPLGAYLFERFPGATLVPHEELKARTATARFVVRTGEATPYANVILRSGVPF